MKNKLSSNQSSFRTVKLAIFWFLFLGVPCMLWLQSMLPLLPLTGLNVWMRTLGQLLGTLGLVLFAGNYILAARYRFLESVFEGLNQVYILHHKIGAVGFVLLLMHPLFLSFQYLSISVAASAQFFIPWLQAPYVRFGSLALNVLILLMVLTFFVKLAYNTWLKTHKFLGVALFFAFFHILLSQGRLASASLLYGYLLLFLGLAIFSYVRITLIKPLLIKKYAYTVKSVALKNDQITELVLSPKGKKLQYRPGQFIFVRFPNSLGIEKSNHPFSITSTMQSDDLSVVVKSLGDFTYTLKLLKPGDLAFVEGPYGYFTHSRLSNRTQLWIAGGIGITPFLSMARSLKNQEPYDITLFYVIRSPSDAVYLNELFEIAKHYSKLHIELYYSQSQGRITAKTISQRCLDFQTREILLCGAPAMMHQLKKQFMVLGVSKKHIHTEEFALYLDD